MADSFDVACSFCDKHKDQVQKLIVSERVSICNECVTLCQDLLLDGEVDTNKSDVINDPRLLKHFLDQYVIGQHNAKIVLSVAVINHYKRLQRHSRDPEIGKANILMLGPTGSGKTLLAKTVARFLDVPFVVADATSITEAGYVGDDVESLIGRLYAISGNDIERTQRGIVFVDEIDKISRKSESTSITRDVSGEGVQQALLKLVEGTVCRIAATGTRKNPTGDMIEIDTSNILFIAGGAFVGLEDVIRTRTQSTGIGFGAMVDRTSGVNFDLVMPDDLVKYGLIPEFVGRFPCTVALEELTRSDMVRVLTEVKNNLIQQYQWLFEQDSTQLEMTEDALEALVDRAIKTGTGARGLQSELERALLPHMFDLVAYREQNLDQVLIDAQAVNNPSSLLKGH